MVRTKQLRPLERILRLPLDLSGFCDGLRAAAAELYPDASEVAEALRRKAAHLQYLRANRACIETDHPLLPPDDASASAFVEWCADEWSESRLANIVARADQLLGRTRLLSFFNRRNRSAT